MCVVCVVMCVVVCIYVCMYVCKHYVCNVMYVYFCPSYIRFCFSIQALSSA